MIHCYECGHPMRKPYKVHRWHKTRPPKHYCWLCWDKLTHVITTKSNDNLEGEEWAAFFLAGLLIPTAACFIYTFTGIDLAALSRYVLKITIWDWTHLQ